MPFPRRPRTAAAVIAALASAGVLATQVLAVPPAADFTVAPGVPDVGDAVTFDSTVTDEDPGDTFSYAWDFGDGNDSTDEDPSHAYTTSGTKTVTLTVTDDPGGETTTVTRNVRVNAPPNASFDFDPATPRPNEEVAFTSSSSDAEGGVTLAWDTDNDGAFDDGTDTTEVRTYPTGGNKTVRLRVTDGDGATTVATRTVPVFNNSPPVASFTVTPAVPDVNQAIALASNSTDPDGDTTIVGWRWDLDNDGLYDERFGRSIQHSFATPGIKTVGLQVTDSSGATSDTTRTFTVNALPVPVINVLNSAAEAGQRQGVPLAGQPFEFTAAAVGAQDRGGPCAWLPRRSGVARPTRLERPGRRSHRLRVGSRERRHLRARRRGSALPRRRLSGGNADGRASSNRRRRRHRRHDLHLQGQRASGSPLPHGARGAAHQHQHDVLVELERPGRSGQHRHPLVGPRWRQCLLRGGRDRREGGAVVTQLRAPDTVRLRGATDTGGVTREATRRLVVQNTVPRRR